MITRVKADGLRGRTFDYELEEKTILVGRNGSGKSSIAAAIQLAFLGYLPGSDKKGAIVFQNASGDSMEAGVTINGKEIVRTWQKGKTLAERIAINGTEAPRNAAASMLELSIGKDPVVVDVPLFFASTPNEQRRMLLRMVADEKTLKQLDDQEETARDQKNAKTRERQVADKAVENLTLSLAKQDKPTGDLGRIEADIKAIEKERAELQQRIADGEANDRARKGVEQTMASIENMEKKLAEARKERDICKSDVKACLDEIKGLGTKEVPKKAGCTLPENVQEIIKKSVFDLRGMNVPDDPGIESACESIADNLEALIAFDEAAWKAEHDAYSVWASAKAVEENRLLNVQKRGRETENAISKLTGQIQEAKKADKKLDKIGKGPDQKDVAAFDGLQTRLTELRAKQKPLIEFAAIQKEMEKARIQAQKASEEEATAKEALGEAVLAQKAVVNKAATLLAERSRAILPQGELEIIDSEEALSICWKREGLTVNQRTLSGGEKVVFSAAVGYSLSPTALVILECAEVDDARLEALLHYLVTRTEKVQYLCLTCHPPKAVPGEWKVIQVGE